MEAPVVETHNLTRYFGGVAALKDLNMRIERGSIYGFIGPNGAGKTTTMRILATLLAPTAGEAWVSGYPVMGEPYEVRQRIGYMPDFFGVYDNMRVWEYLDFFAASYGVPPEKRRGMIDDLLALVDLPVKRESFVEELSRGMKQRLCLARTLVHDPDLLILDEPASGLDPRARIELRELLRELQRMGKTILVSSHILTELAEMCTHIGIIERGKLLVSGSVSEILKDMRPAREIVVRVLGAAERAVGLLEKLDGVLGVRADDGRAFAGSWARPNPSGSPYSGSTMDDGETMDEQPALSEGKELEANGAAGSPQSGATPAAISLQPTTIYLRVDGDETILSAILAKLVQANIPVYGFEERVGDLEEVFLHTTKGLVQ